MDTDEETARHEIAAFWGSAENTAYSTEERLRFALAALDKMWALVPEVED